MTGAPSRRWRRRRRAELHAASPEQRAFCRTTGSLRHALQDAREGHGGAKQAHPDEVHRVQPHALDHGRGQVLEPQARGERGELLGQRGHGINSA